MPVFVHPLTDPQLHKRFAPLGRIGVRLARATINSAAPSGAFFLGWDPNGVSINSRRSESEFTGTANLSYKPSKDLLFYASYSRGYKSGGFNPPVSVGLAMVPTTFIPDSDSSSSVVQVELPPGPAWAQDAARSVAAASSGISPP